jgi:hypothetical protein
MEEQLPTFDGPRSFLLVSAGDPVTAERAVAEWAEGPPDLCVTSPSQAAHDTANAACAKHDVPMLDEPLLAGRLPDESGADYASRTAEALRTLNAFDTRAALVVWDDLFTEGGRPVVFDGEGLLRRADSIERDTPPP